MRTEDVLDLEIATSTRTADTRIQKDVLVEWRTELSQWTTCDAFRTRIDNLADGIPRNTFFRQAGLTFMRDAWIASRVASALSSDMVRLIASDRPDFEIRIGSHILQFEATEADIEGRRRGDEPDDPHPRMDPVENWRKRFEAIPSALDRVVAKKIEKDYAPEVNLVIYLNLGCYGAYVEEGLPIIQDRTEAARNKFKSVYVLWEGELYKFWENGSSVFEKWTYVSIEDFSP
jgi:hypothetical protein